MVTYMMTYFLGSDLDPSEIFSSGEILPTESSQRLRAGVHLLGDKLEIPDTRDLVPRPRLYELLNRSVQQFPATLISGRAGTGKTALAASFATTRKNAAWYSIEPADVEWTTFVNYLAASILRTVLSRARIAKLVPSPVEPTQAAMATALMNIFGEVETEIAVEPMLIVLDGIHHLFDAPWFGEFFALLLSSLPENVNLLLLCRSKPPNPLWRLRSKQQLNVIDEKLLAFDLAETSELVTSAGLDGSNARRVQAETFGRISKLLQVVPRKTSGQQA